jgi:tetratricopeptide (TPR) repeat protein
MIVFKNKYFLAIMMFATSLTAYALIEIVDNKAQNESIYTIELPQKHFLKPYKPLVNSINTDLLVSQAKKLIAKKEYNKAYKMLKPQEYELNENIEFNYQFGVASLRAGKYQDAIYAFDRVSDEDRYHLGSRLDLAIAYYYLGNLPYARKEFVKLGQAERVPAFISKTIKAYIAKIDAESAAGSPMKITAAIKTGYSSNINSGYDGDYVYIPILDAQSKLSDDSKKQGSSFIEATLAISKTHEITKESSVKADVVLKKKTYNANKNLDQSSVAFGVSGKYKVAGYDLELGKNYLNSSLGGNPNYTTETTQVKVTTRPSKTQKLSAAMGFSSTKFDLDASKINNSTGNSLTLSASDLIFADIGAGIDYTHNSKIMDDSTSSNGDSKANSIRLSMRKRLFGIAANLSFGYRDEKYNAENPLFEEFRHDATTTISIGGEKLLSKGKSFDLYIGYNNTTSNIELYSTDNVTTSIGYKSSF